MEEMGGQQATVLWPLVYLVQPWGRAAFLRGELLSPVFTPTLPILALEYLLCFKLSLKPVLPQLHWLLHNTRLRLQIGAGL